MDAETWYLVRHNILHDAYARGLHSDDPERHAWALDQLKSGAFGDDEPAAYAEQMARHARFARQARSPAADRALADLEVHYLNLAWRRAIRDHRIPEALALVDRLAALSEVTQRDRMDALLKASVALRMDQRPQQAAEYARRGLALAETAEQQARAHHELGNAHNTARQLEEADEAYQQALDLAREGGDERLVAAALCNLGSLRRQQGRTDEALVFLNQAVRQGRESGAVEYEGTAYLHLGFLHSISGRPAEAREGFEAALRVLENTPKEIFRVDACYQIGGLALQDGDFATAERHVDNALAIARRLGYRVGLGQALNFAAMVHDAAGRGAEALSALREAVGVAREAGDQLNAAVGLSNLGYALLREERLDEAQHAFSEAEHAAEQGRNTYAAGFAAAGQGDVRRKRGKLIDAWMNYERAIQLLEMAGFKPGVLRVRARLGGVMAQSGEVDAARDLLRACVEQAKALKLTEELELASAELAAIDA